MKKSASILDLFEGPHDPGIFKAVFTAGGPGSGKTTVAQKLGLFSLGLRQINSDNAFTLALKKAGQGLKLDYVDPEIIDTMRVRAKQLTAKQMELAIQGRLGLVIDSTARDADKIVAQKKALENLGYETKMLFVDASLETALKRNEERPRSVPVSVVQKSHEEISKNKDKLQQIFKKDFIAIPNDGGLKELEQNTNKLYAKVSSWVKSLPSSPLVKHWLDKFKTALENEMNYPNLRIDEAKFDINRDTDRTMAAKFAKEVAELAKIKFDPEDALGTIDKAFGVIRKGSWSPPQWQKIQQMVRLLDAMGIKLPSIKGMYMGQDSKNKPILHEVAQTKDILKLTAKVVDDIEKYGKQGIENGLIPLVSLVKNIFPKIIKNAKKYSANSYLKKSAQRLVDWVNKIDKTIKTVRSDEEYSTLIDQLQDDVIALLSSLEENLNEAVTLPANINDVRMSTLYTLLFTAVTKKLETLPSSAPVAVQIMDGLADVEKEIKPHMNKKGIEAIKIFTKAASGTFTASMPPLSTLVKKYKLKTTYGGEVIVESIALQCQECGHKFKKDKPTSNTKCPKCKGYDIDLDYTSNRNFRKKDLGIKEGVMQFFKGKNKNDGSDLLKGDEYLDIEDAVAKHFKNKNWSLNGLGPKNSKETYVGVTVANKDFDFVYNNSTKKLSLSEAIPKSDYYGVYDRDNGKILAKGSKRDMVKKQKELGGARNFGVCITDRKVGEKFGNADRIRDLQTGRLVSEKSAIVSTSKFQASKTFEVTYREDPFVANVSKVTVNKYDTIYIIPDKNGFDRIYVDSEKARNAKYGIIDKKYGLKIEATSENMKAVKQNSKPFWESVNEVTVWEYKDATGVTRKGTVVKTMDHGGTDVTYMMQRLGDKTIDVLSGERLKKAKVLHRYQKAQQYMKDNINEFTISDVQRAIRKRDGKGDMHAGKISHDEMKKIEKLKKLQNGGNVTRNDLKKVGLDDLIVESSNTRRLKTVQYDKFEKWYNRVSSKYHGAEGENDNDERTFYNSDGENVAYWDKKAKNGWILEDISPTPTQATTTDSIPKGPESVAIHPDGTFCNHAVFDCDGETFCNCIKGKKKHGRWSSYLGKDNPFYSKMQQWMGQSYKNNNFVLRNKTTGEMAYARNIHETVLENSPGQGRLFKFGTKFVGAELSKNEIATIYTALSKAVGKENISMKKSGNGNIAVFKLPDNREIQIEREADPFKKGYARFIIKKVALHSNGMSKAVISHSMPDGENVNVLKDELQRFIKTILNDEKDKSNVGWSGTKKRKGKFRPGQ